MASLAHQTAHMRISLFPVLIWILVLCGCRKESTGEAATNAARAERTSTDVALRVNFVGTEKLFADTNTAFLSGIWSMPETQAYRDELMQKIARVPFHLFRNRISSTNDFAPLLKPLVEDAVRAGFFAEARGTNRNPEIVFAIRLSPERAQLWNTNLAKIFQAWLGSGISQKESGKWEVKNNQSQELFRLTRAKDWLLVGLGSGELPFHKESVSNIEKNGRPGLSNSSACLELVADFARVKSHFKVPEAIADSQLQLAVTGNGTDLKTRGTIRNSKDFELKLDSWRIPTNSILEPLVSFTALRGISPYVARSRAGRAYDSALNQIYLWALEPFPFQTFALMSCNDSTNTFKRMAPKLMSSLSTNLFHREIGSIIWNSNRTGLVWKGLPVVIPYLQPVKEPAGEFLYAGMFPKIEPQKKMPGELVAQVLGTKSLVYYSWEITGARISQWQNILQVYGYAAQHQPVQPSSAPEKWLEAVSAKCENAITQITLNAPNELLFERKSKLGLTAFELVALVRWTETKTFPKLGFGRSPHPQPAGKAAPRPR
jgi:hypothetical protein